MYFVLIIFYIVELKNNYKFFQIFKIFWKKICGNKLIGKK